MPDVAGYIESYGVKKFLNLSSREQNSLLYAHWFHAKPTNLRMQKKAFLDKLINVKNVKEIVNTDIPPDDPHPVISPTTPPNPAGGASPAPLKKLTEEIFEDALVRVLEADPAKALGPALSFLDKKKSLSIDDEDTQQSEEARKYYSEVLKNVYS